MKYLFWILAALFSAESAAAQTEKENFQPKGSFNGYDRARDTISSVPKPRKRLTTLSADDIQSEVNCVIAMTLIVDADGNVVNALIDKKKTTSDDEELIKKILQKVKEQIKYEKISGGMQKIFYKVSISAK